MCGAIGGCLTALWPRFLMRRLAADEFLLVLSLVTTMCNRRESSQVASGICACVATGQANASKDCKYVSCRSVRRRRRNLYRMGLLSGRQYVQ